SGDTSQQASTDNEGETQAVEGDVPELKVWIKKSFSEEADDALAERLKEFGTTTGKCTVSVEFIPNANFGVKYAAAVESGEVPALKDRIKKSISEEADDALADRIKEFVTSTGKCTVSVEFIPNANFGEKYAEAVESGEVLDVAFMTLYLLRQYYDNVLMMEI